VPTQPAPANVRTVAEQGTQRSNDDLIALAAGVLRPHVAAGRLFGDVGAALVSQGDHIYTGVSVDTASWGLCAERSAIAAMITAGEYRIARIVAVWRDSRSGALSVLSPCGVCREFMRAVDDGNLSTEIILGRQGSVLLQDLLPHHHWPEPLDT